MRDESVTKYMMRPGGTPPGRGEAAQLVVLQGCAPGLVVELDRPSTRIGRRKDNDLVLDSSAVSKYHARIVRDGNRYYVDDLGSTNGVLRNGVPLSPSERCMLCHGDTLSISDQLLLFRNQEGLVNDKGMSTITFDMTQVRAEADALFADLPGLMDEVRRVRGS